MSARRQIIAALSAGSVSGTATLYDVDHATRLVDAHAAQVRAETRSEALHEAAAEAESLIRLFPQDTDWGAAIAGALEGLAFRLRRKGGEKATAAAATATPFFQRGHTYTREHHGMRIEFIVRSIDTSPDGKYRVARGWRADDYSGHWEPADSDDMDGWTDVTEAGESRD